MIKGGLWGDKMCEWCTERRKSTRASKTPLHAQWGDSDTDSTQRTWRYRGDGLGPGSGALYSPLCRLVLGCQCWGHGEGDSTSPGLCPGASGTLWVPRQEQPPRRMVTLARGVEGQGGNIQSHSLPRGSLHPSNAKHQAGLQKDPGEQALPRDQGA